MINAAPFNANPASNLSYLQTLDSIKSFVLAGVNMIHGVEWNRLDFKRSGVGNRALIICAIETSMDQPQTENGVKRSLNVITTPVKCAASVAEGYKPIIFSRSSDSLSFVMSSQMAGRSANLVTERLIPMDGRRTGINAKRLAQEVLDFDR